MVLDFGKFGTLKQYNFALYMNNAIKGHKNRQVFCNLPFFTVLYFKSLEIPAQKIM